MYSLTIFKNQFDNKTHRKMEFTDWASFTQLLMNLSKIPRAGKKDAELISPAVYEQGTTRANKNVIHWGKWAAVDVDDYEGTLEDVVRKIEHYNFVIYSTASSKRGKPKFRIVFDLNRSVEKEEVRHFWFALNKSLGDLGDPQTKDSSRMYYVPAEYVGAFNFIQCNSGAPVDVDELKAKYEFVDDKGKNFIDSLPDELQKKVIEYRMGRLENVDYRWSSYRDCPFFPRKLAAEYRTISSAGWYHTMYRIMVAIALKAISKGYPITVSEISQLCREFDRDTGNWYENRPFEREANSALRYAYKNAEI